MDRGRRPASHVERGLEPAAVFAASEHVALGVWEQLRRKGIRVPEHMSLPGFDDLPDSRAKTPPLTTVRVPFLELGRELGGRRGRSWTPPEEPRISTEEQASLA